MYKDYKQKKSEYNGTYGTTRMEIKQLECFFLCHPSRKLIPDIEVLF